MGAMTAKERRVAELLRRPIDWPCPLRAVEMIALEEDCRLKAYLDIAKVPTCGWGETQGVTLGMVWTQEYADERLRQSLYEWTTSIQGMLGSAPTNENQLTAMLCFAYNVGLGAFKKSTMLKCHLRGDYSGAARAFSLFNKTTDPVTKKKVVSPVLVARRAREAAVYVEPVQVEVEEPPPQTVQLVEPEQPLSKSPIMTAGTVATTMGVLLGSDGFVQQVAPAATTVSQIATSMNVPPTTVLAVLLIAFGGVAMYWRWKQRNGGWA